MPFTSFGLDASLLRAVRELGFTRPTPIQSQAIPPGMLGKDVLACAMTGSAAGNAARTAAATSSGNRARFSSVPPNSSLRRLDSGERNSCSR